MIRKLLKVIAIIFLIVFCTKVLEEMSNMSISENMSNINYISDTSDILSDTSDILSDTSDILSDTSDIIETKKVCKDLRFANKFIDNMKVDLLEQHTSEYFNKPIWVGFEQGYWNGFWKNHDTCKICIANGDVPTI